MFVSSTGGEEAVTRLMERRQKAGTREFSRILDKQISDLLKNSTAHPDPPIHAATQTRPAGSIFRGLVPNATLRTTGGKTKFPDPVTRPTPDAKPVEATGETVNGKKANSLGKSGLHLLGTISKGSPTVSHLLIRDPVFGRDCWKILHSGINSDKPYSRIPEGSRIYLDPETREIVWKRDSVPVEGILTAHGVEQPEKEEIPTSPPDPFSKNLARAVRPYLGRPYREMNCFELVARGLEEIGIPYYGRHGLGERLVRMAAEKGLSMNHYLSGEGLIETTGSQVYSKSFEAFSSAGIEAYRVYRELAPLLHEGMILSFSTPTRGHTGIVSRKQGRWTYINSGYMDNRLGGRAPKGVGEEILRSEIRNWFRLAARKGEPLQITVGRLDEERIRAVLTGRRARISPVPGSSI